MQATDSPFRIDVLDAAGNRLGDGPLRYVETLTDTRSLDKIGTLEFGLSATDPRVRLFNTGTQFDVYDAVDGYLGRYWFQGRKRDVSDGEAVITIVCQDALRELGTRSVGLRRNYLFTDVRLVIEDLIDVMGPGWVARADEGIGDTTINFEGESVLIAIDALRDRWGQHYRLGARVGNIQALEFGAFGDTAPVRLVGGTAAPPPELEGQRESAWIKQFRDADDRAEICNTILPLGAGEGTTQLTIELADLGDYAVLAGVNADGSPYYYIQDADSVAAYGVIERVLVNKGVRPLSNSDADIRNAANALKLAAEAYLARRRGLTRHYNLVAQGVRRDIQPGQRVPVRYTGERDGFIYLDVDESLWVMDVTRQRRASGERATVLGVATDDQRRTADSDLMLDIMHDLNALKVHVPIQLTYRDIGPYTRRIDSANTATFVARIQDEVLALNRAILTLRTSPLKSSVQGTSTSAAVVGTTADGGGAVLSSAAGGDHHHKIFDYLGGSPASPTVRRFNCAIERTGGLSDEIGSLLLDMEPASAANWDYIRTYDASGDHTHGITIPDHDHDITIPAHSHTPSYGIYADTVHPQTVGVMIDGIDRTAALGGPWALSNVAIDLELNITDYLVNASGGLRQNHTIVISCASGRGEVEVGVEMLCAIQAIAVS